ncbi:MAG TPA: FtsX-like permease family protein [Tepidisphaeraceae bacterium]|nr:FtsX-like permease family protein [Tepidisphaeraceae bacterium]
MYKLHLILKYLLKRRIAWVSLVAVTLCTLMVLVVISVMGGWLNMFKSSFRGLSGDIVVHSDGMAGFPYYERIIASLKKDSDIAAAIPSIETYGLLNFGRVATLPVKVMGIPIDEMGEVNRFPDSLYRQHVMLEDKLNDKTLAPEERKKLERILASPPSFDLLDEMTVPLAALPSDLPIEKIDPDQDQIPGTVKLPDTAPQDLRGRLRYDAVRKNLVFQGPMKVDWKDPLASLSADADYKRAVDTLFRESNTADLIDYSQLAKGRLTGMIAGTGVIGIHRNHNGEWEGRESWKTSTPVGLTVLDISGGGGVSVHDKVTRTYFIVDDSRTQVWQYDNNYVYVPLDRLQKDLGMNLQQVSDAAGNAINVPGRVTDIHIKVRARIDPNDEPALNRIADRVRSRVHEVMHGPHPPGGPTMYGPDPRVETWQETQRIWINAIENEKMLVVFLFGIISVVAIFLIFCIFYMIVVEKTRDIGIIKSVGATSAGVASIFLGYGLVIGVLGSGLGLLLSFLLVHNINEIHGWLGRRLGIVIWNPEVYLFDKIPNQMSFHDIVWIVPIAILASVLGALVPAIRAASVNPVESLRWE